MNNTELNKLKKSLGQKAKQFKKSQTESFRDMCSVIFDAFPEVESFGFTGYTPEFNDGDECLFTCYLNYPTVNGYDSNRQKWVDEKDRTEEETNDACELTDKVGKVLSEIPKALISGVFGSSGFTATITRDKIEVEDYDCGY